MAVEIISRSISTKVWDRAGIKLATPVSVVRCVTDSAMRPGMFNFGESQNKDGAKKKV